jgi:ankyrin repeat protein
LILAAIKGLTETVTVLVKAKAGLDYHDKNGATALMWAAIKGPTETVTVLVKAKAGLDYHDKV